MRKAIISFCTLLISSAPCFAAVDDFNPFWLKFKGAVAKKDKETVASMTKLPFLYDSKYLKKEQFIAKYNQVFPASVEACFKKEKPIHDRDCYEVFCGESIYVFSKESGKYLFTDIGVND